MWRQPVLLCNGQQVFRGIQGRLSRYAVQIQICVLHMLCLLCMLLSNGASRRMQLRQVLLRACLLLLLLSMLCPMLSMLRLLCPMLWMLSCCGV